jgi:hypothetical protein
MSQQQGFKFGNKKTFELLSPTRISLYVYKDNKKNRALNRVGKDKFFSLSLNEYRNAHYRVLNDAKAIYNEVMYRALVQCDLHLAKMNQISIEYQIIACNKRSFDIMNFVCVIDKFFQDVLEKTGVIKNDSYKHVIRFEILPVVHSTEFSENICKITVREI